MGGRDHTTKQRRLRDQIEVEVTRPDRPYEIPFGDAGAVESPDPLIRLMQLLEKVTEQSSEAPATPPPSSNRSEIITVVSEMQRSLEQFVRQRTMLKRLLTRYH